jgi:Domain of unknown function (DUF1707)
VTPTAATGPGRGYARCVDEQSGSGRIRASDAERERAARFLAAAFTEGRLDLVEYDKRVATAYEAVYRDELNRLFDDLPPSDRPSFDLRPASRSKAAPTPVPLPPGEVVGREGRRPYGWPLVVVMFVGALFLARIGWFGPFAVLMLLFGLAAVIGGISAETERRGRRPRP